MNNTSPHGAQAPVSHSLTNLTRAGAPSRTRSAPGSKIGWDTVTQMILDKTDIQAVAESFGVKFVSRSASAAGWRECHRVAGTEKGEPGSCAVNIGSLGSTKRGRYWDFGHGEVTSCSFFDLLVLLRAFPDWRAAREYLAAKANVALPGKPDFTPRPARPNAAPPSAKRKVKPSQLREDLTHLVELFHAHGLATGDLHRMAAELYVHPDALISQRVGFPAHDTRDEFKVGDGRNSLWPEYQVVGLKNPTPMTLNRRPNGKGRKQVVSNRPRGLSLSAGWWNFARDRRHLIICEGGSDVAACHSMGVGAIGISSRGADGDQVIELIRRVIKKGVIPADTRITCTIDRYDDGAGLHGMRAISQQLAIGLNRPVDARYAPTVPDYSRVQELRSEFAAQLPFMADPDDPRWETWHEHKGVPKDTREWLSWLANAWTTPFEARYLLGTRFLSTLEGGFDVHSEVEDAGAVATEPPPSPPSEEGGALLLCKKPTNSEETAPPPYRVKRPPLLIDWDAVESALAPLAALPANLPCPDVTVIPCGKKGAPAEGMGIPCPCNCWTCIACCYRRKSEWGYHLAGKFLSYSEPEPTELWRGPARDLTRVTKRIRKKGGQHVAILSPGNMAVVIATKGVPGSTLIDRTDAVREMIAAVVAVEYRPPTKGKKHRPIRATHNWKLPAHPKSGMWESLSSRFVNPDRSHDVLKAMGVDVRAPKSARATYRFPAGWGYAHRKWAAKWAVAETVPPGTVRGKVPPDPALVIAYLCAGPTCGAAGWFVSAASPAPSPSLPTAVAPISAAVP